MNRWFAGSEYMVGLVDGNYLMHTHLNWVWKKMKMKILNFPLMRMTQENFYFNLVLFTFASQLYSYVLGPSSLLSS